MKKSHFISLIVCSSLSTIAVAADENAEDLPTVEVVGKKINDVNIQEVKSADLAEALSKKVAGISLVRRSGIANDIILRGQKKDNINILIDGAKIHGACPNRMDPPTAHILTNNIDTIEVIEGPYDVLNFGTLSGAVRISTIKPEQDFSGNVSLNVGSFDYQKFAATLSGGTEKVRAMIGFSQETGGQYEDGDGNDFAQQILEDNAMSMARFKPENEDMDAYEKNTFMAKVFADVADNQSVELSYTMNESDDVLYPSSPMDALYDDSEMINLNYIITELGKYSNELAFQFYDSSVEHPMSTFYRMSSGPNSANEKISYLETHSQGLKVINEMDMSDISMIKFGVDLNNRNWDGTYEGFGTNAGITGVKSIADVDTENAALFVEVNQDYDDLKLKFGARFDDTSIGPNVGSLAETDFTAFSAFVFGTYQLNETHQLFAGVGKASRVPDARELYFMTPMMGGMLIGNPDLEQTTNTEIDFGIEHTEAGFNMKAKIFYSMLSDYIHFNASKAMRKFDNVDATIYGLDVSGTYDISDATSVDFGMAYLKGEKDEALAGQTDTDLAEIPPLKMNVALNYEYQKNSSAMLEMVAANGWKDFDADNGEQELDGWSVLNVKVKHQFTEAFGITAGVDNLMDETYAVSNTYKDLTLLADGTGEVMLMNEPGRYVYLNAVYSF